MKRLIKKSRLIISSWTVGPNEKIDPMKQHFIDNFGEGTGLELYNDINSDNITYIEEGKLSIDSIKNLKGFSGENHQWTEYPKDNGENYRFFGKYSEEDWNDFLEDIKNNGIVEPIEIVVSNDGKTAILNGNHRLQAALQLNLVDIPVVVKYKDNSENTYKLN